MKKGIIILFAIIISINSYSQEETKNFRIGVILTLDSNLSSERIEFDKYRGYIAEYNKTNYKIGISAEYLLKNGFTINSGFNYSNKNFTGTYYCAVCNFLIPPSPEKIEMQFVEIPLSLRYYFLPSSLKVYADIGLINQFSLKNKIIENKYNISGKLGFGIEYNLNSNLAFQLGTEYNHGLTNIFKESNFKIKTISFGLGIIKKI